MIFSSKAPVILAVSLFGLAACEKTYEQAALTPIIMVDGSVVQHAVSTAKDGFCGDQVTGWVTGVDQITNKLDGMDEFHVSVVGTKSACANLVPIVAAGALGSTMPAANIDLLAESESISGATAIANAQ